MARTTPSEPVVAPAEPQAAAPVAAPVAAPAEPQVQAVAKSQPRLIQSVTGGSFHDPFTGHVYGPAPTEAREGGWLDAQIAMGKLQVAPDA